MFKSLSASLNSYLNRPVQFITSTLTCCFFSALVLFALSGIFLIFFFTLSALKITDNTVPFAVLGAVLGLVLIYLLSAFKGALIKAYSLLASGSKFSFMDFYRYAVGNGWNFFALTLAKLALIILFGIPAILLYIYVSSNPIQYVDILVYLLALGAVFLAELLLYPAFIAAAVSNSGFTKSFGLAFQLFRRKHVFAIVIFIVYAFAWLLGVLTVLDIAAYYILNNQLLLYALVILLPLSALSLLVLSPIAYTALILFFHDYAGRDSGRGSGRAERAERAEPSSSPSVKVQTQKQKKEAL